MKILFDTNVVLDALLDREPFSRAALQLFTQVETGKLTGLLSATTITTIFYLATKVLGKAPATKAITQLLRLFEVAPVHRLVLEEALTLDFSDFEDAVLCQAGLHAGAQAIVTRDRLGFKKATIGVYTPEELLGHFI